MSAIRRMMMGGKNNILYQASNIVFDRTNYIDTGLQLMNGGDFSITMNFTITQVNATTSVFLSCRDTSLLLGFDIRFNNTNYVRPVLNNTGYNLGSPRALNDIIELYITKIGNTMTITDGVSTVSGTVTTTDKPLTIGANAVGTSKATFKLNSIIVLKL